MLNFKRRPSPYVCVTFQFCKKLARAKLFVWSPYNFYLVLFSNSNPIYGQDCCLKCFGLPKLGIQNQLGRYIVVYVNLRFLGERHIWDGFFSSLLFSSNCSGTKKTMSMFNHECSLLMLFNIRVHHMRLCRFPFLTCLTFLSIIYLVCVWGTLCAASAIYF